MAEQPPLNRSYVISYAGNDRDYPVIGLRLDPRVAGYRVPEDLSPHPDSKRYPNHVFTGSQPSNGDERVTHVYEILPSPYVPFTRYDDDLGPIQGRRRSVKNEGQEASLASDKKVSYEGREGSAIVSNEIEETWSIATDEDGDSLFPIKDRDFYDASRGAVQERRQLFVPTGEEEGTLENVNGVITQTSYEPYNEFLSVKIVQTYKVDGPQLIGQATNNEGQLVTVTTQRKGALGYIPPNPTATRTVEASREDAESLVERIVDTPKVFSAQTFSIERPDNVPQKFKAKLPVFTTQQNITGIAQAPTLESGQFSKSEEQVTEFVKRISTTSRDLSQKETLTGVQYTSELGGGFAVVTETYPFDSNNPTIPEFGIISDEVENLGDGTRIRRQVKLQPQAYNLGTFSDSGNPLFGETLQPLKGQDYDEALDIVIPYEQVVAQPLSVGISTGQRRRVTPRDVSHSIIQKYDVKDIQDSLDDYYWEIPDMIDINLPDILKKVTLLISGSGASGSGSGFGNTYSWSRTARSSVNGSISYDIEQGFQGTIPTIRAIFFLPKENASPNDVLAKINLKRGDVSFWPNVKPESHLITITEGSFFSEESVSVSFDSGSNSSSSGGTFEKEAINIPPTIHGRIEILSEDGGSIGATSVSVNPRVLEKTEFPKFPTGLFLYKINATPYKFSYVRVDALLVDITNEYV